VSIGVFPDWIKKSLTRKKEAEHLKYIFRSKKIHTVCEEAKCPNIGECFSKKTATFLIMGNICTRDCGFCAIEKGIPEPLDKSEPNRIAKQVKEIGLKYAVLTSPSRDDIIDGGAGFFARTVEQIKRLNTDTRVEVLIPDFRGNVDSLEEVIDSGIDVLNHNIETVQRLYPKVRPKAGYELSLDIIKEASRLKPNLPLKSGFMLGLGEKKKEVVKLLKDLKSVGCNIITIGQYLRPTLKQLPVDRYVHPDEFKKTEEMAYEIGFDYVASGPLVRSSHRAEELFSGISIDRLRSKK
jgi:lipoic acid synthetase